MDLSVTESEHYTPRHNYNTRLQAKYSSSSILIPKLKTTRENSVIRVNNNEIVPKEFKFDDSLERNFNSDDFLITNNNNKINYNNIKMGWQDRTYTCTGPSCQINNRPPLPPKNCPQNEFWNKYSKHIFVSALLGMMVIPMLNNMFQTFYQLTTDVEQLKKDSKMTKMKLQSIDNSLSAMNSGSFNIKSMVQDEMDKLSSDKTGKTDYALESTGGSIVTLLPDTENYSKPKNLFGLTLCEGSNGPRAMLQIGTAPGQCWAFKGSSGGAIVKLVGAVNIDSISLEHIPKQMSPTGEISTAPKDFAVIALRSPTDNQGSYLGQFKYDIDGPALQTFKVECGYPVEYISFKVLSNHGHMDFTCIYRLRVHGSLSKTTHSN